MNEQSELNEILELVRLEELEKYKILDTPEDPFYNDVALLAAQICKTPMAFVSFVDEKELWLKSKIGLGIKRIPRELSMCQHTIKQTEVLIISDLTKDPRFCDSPFVVSAPFLRFYAGISIVNSTGFVLGTICVLDTTARTLTESQISAFSSLQRMVLRDLETRRQSEERWQFMDNLMRVE